MQQWNRFIATSTTFVQINKLLIQITNTYSHTDMPNVPQSSQIHSFEYAKYSYLFLHVKSLIPCVWVVLRRSMSDQMMMRLHVDLSSASTIATSLKAKVNSLKLFDTSPCHAFGLSFSMSL